MKGAGGFRSETGKIGGSVGEAPAAIGKVKAMPIKAFPRILAGWVVRHFLIAGSIAYRSRRLRGETFLKHNKPVSALTRRAGSKTDDGLPERDNARGFRVDPLNGSTPMTAATATLLLVIFLPFLLSLAAEVAMPKVLCFMASLLALLLVSNPTARCCPGFWAWRLPWSPCASGSAPLLVSSARSGRLRRSVRCVR